MAAGTHLPLGTFPGRAEGSCIFVFLVLPWSLLWAFGCKSTYNRSHSRLDHMKARVS